VSPAEERLLARTGLRLEEIAEGEESDLLTGHIWVMLGYEEGGFDPIRTSLHASEQEALDAGEAFIAEKVLQEEDGVDFLDMVEGRIYQVEIRDPEALATLTERAARAAARDADADDTDAAYAAAYAAAFDAAFDAVRVGADEEAAAYAAYLAAYDAVRPHGGSRGPVYRPTSASP
jgi:hypothetical protein